MIIFKDFLFILTLIYAGYYDYKKRIIPDKVHIIIIILALISNFNFIQSIIGFIILPIPFIVPIFFNEESIGGGDIKIVASIGFYLGLVKGIVAIVIGLSLSILISIIILKRYKNNSIPLAPYLATGSIIALLL